MGKRLAPVLAILAMLIPTAGNALGLGNITMKSALNQPLDAEIQLLSVQSGDLDNLVVRLGSDEDFARVGADRAFFLTKIVFKIEKKPNGTPYIKLSTLEAVTEPYLDFVVEARWPRGRLLREFTVLVDPPSMSQEAPAPVQQPVVQAAPAPRAAAPAPAAAAAQPAPMPERARLQPVMHRGGELSYGPVKRNDTLWVIANQMRPHNVSVNQMMLALVRDNPQAFYNGNVNQLKAGYVLRVKDPAALGTVTVAEADAEIERQRVEWQARKSGRLVKQTAMPAGEVAAAGEAPAAPAAGAKQTRLKLVAPGSEGAGSGSGSKDVAQLRKDLLIAAESLDANRQETEELKNRLSEMEEQLQAMQRLIMLKDDEMLALQKQLGQKPEGAAAAKPAEAPAMPAETAAKPEMAASETEAKPAMAEAPAPKPAPVQEKPKKTVVPPPAPEPSLFDSPLLMYGGLGVVVLALVGWLVVRRRKMQEGFQESILNVDAAAAGGAGAAAAAAGGESSMVSDFAMSEMSDMEGIQADTAEVDPISEADVYLAYGRHQQAEDIIREALEKTPERNDLKLKMLEVYFAAKKRDEFETAAQELHDTLGDESDPLWARAVTMGSQLCPDNELFGGASVDALKEQLSGDVSAAEEDLLDFDFDIDSADLGGAETDTAEALDFESELEAATASDSDAGLDFDLDLGGAEEATPAEAETAVAEEEDTGLDFDVSSLDFNLEQGEADAETVAEAEAAGEALDFDLGSLEEETETAPQAEAAVAAEAAAGDLSLEGEGPAEEAAFEMDLGELSLAEAEPAEAGAGEEPALEMDLDDLGLEEAEAVVGEETTSAEPELGDELEADIFGEVDEVGTKLDLAKAYVDMGDSDGARSILDEVLEEGDDTQKQQAQEMLAQID
jgi:pilus assembly protein FimV